MSNLSGFIFPAKHVAKRSSILDTAFMRKYGILLIVVLSFIFWTLMMWLIASGITKARVTNALTQKYDIEYETRINKYIADLEAANTPTEDEYLQRQIRMEADYLARVIGTMSTKQMKLSMLWNILMRVDSPYYPNTVKEVIEQPDQWMFYNESNPIRQNDVSLAIEQLKLWHDGRYPSNLSSSYVYGEWSEHDYVLRDTWDKSSKTNYWRYQE
jgi:hypothetical protein